MLDCTRENSEYTVLRPEGDCPSLGLWHQVPRIERGVKPAVSPPALRRSSGEDVLSTTSVGVRHATTQETPTKNCPCSPIGQTIVRSKRDPSSVGEDPSGCVKLASVPPGLAFAGGWGKVTPHVGLVLTTRLRCRVSVRYSDFPIFVLD